MLSLLLFMSVNVEILNLLVMSMRHSFSLYCLLISLFITLWTDRALVFSSKLSFSLTGKLLIHLKAVIV